MFIRDLWTKGNFASEGSIKMIELTFYWLWILLNLRIFATLVIGITDMLQIHRMLFRRRLAWWFIRADVLYVI